MLCNAGINIAYNGVAVSNGGPVRPIRIVDGGTGPDSIDVLRGDSDFGSAPSTVLQLMAAPTSQIVVDENLNLTAGQIIVAGAYDGSKVCTMFQLSSVPTANGSAWNLPHAASAAMPYNTASPTSLFTNSPTYDVRDVVVNLGTHGWRRFGVVCNNGNVPSGSNNCDLASYDLLAVTTPTLATVQSESAQVIDLQAQYGVAPTGSQTVSAWVDATGTWAAPAEADQRRIKALRVAIVARGSRDAQTISPATLTLWDDGNGNAKTRSLSAEERHYRYQVLTVIIPLINTIWANV
jgi:type IV pilus assembly protein PilW